MSENILRAGAEDNTFLLADLIRSGVSLDNPYVVTKAVELSAKLLAQQDHSLYLSSLSHKRIVLAIPYHPLDEIGGLEIGTRKIAAGLKNLGNEVEIITRGVYPQKKLEGEMITPEGIRVIGIGEGISDIAHYLIQNAGKYDIVQWMEIFPPVPEQPEIYNQEAQRQYIASTILRRLGLGIFLYIATSGNMTNRGVDNPSWSRPLSEQKLSCLISGAINGFNFANPQIANEFTQAGLNINANRRKFIPFGVDVDSFHPLDSGQKTKIRKEFGLPEDKFIYIYAGRFVSRKKPDLLIHAWNNLPDYVKAESHLILVGGQAAVGQTDSIYKEVLNLISKTPGVTNIDLIPHDRMPSLMAAADVFVFPTEREGWPLVVCEAMACGLPVISSDIDGVRGMVDKQSGFIFPPNKKAKLELAMIDAFLQRGHMSDLGKIGRQRIAANWTWSIVATNYNNFYNRF